MHRNIIFLIIIKNITVKRNINISRKSVILHIHAQGFIQEKTGFRNGPYIKICDLKMDPSQKSESLKRTVKLKIVMQYLILVELQINLLRND